jgi:hypothetical protein
VRALTYREQDRSAAPHEERSATTDQGQAACNEELVGVSGGVQPNSAGEPQKDCR